jgi:uncharacterized protein
MASNNIETRREFLQKLISATAVMGLSPLMLNCAHSAKGASKLPLRPLGKTGHMVSIYSLGAQGSVEVPGREDVSIEIINRSIDWGINYIDTAASYGRATDTVPRDVARGTSERNVGRVMKERRKEVFLASKTNDRTYDGSMRLLEQSLKNLQTDQLDLWQIHNVKANEIDDLNNFFANDGVVKAMEKARDEKMVRFLGITGHECPAVLNALADRFPFDNVLVAINAADKHFDPFIERFLPNAVKKNMGIVGMKIPARDRIFSNGGIISMKEAMEYVLTLPVSTIVVGIDKVAELQENIEITKNFKPLTADAMLAIEHKTKPYAKDLLFFKNQSSWPTDW